MLLAVAVYFYVTQRESLTITSIRTWVATLGYWAPPLYILAYTIRPLVFFPTSIMTSASVLLFGPLPAWIFAYVGENLSANLAFFVARFLGSDFVQSHENKLIQKYDQKLAHCGFMTILTLRLIPLFPFDFVNYSAGLSRVRHWNYLWGTLLGVIPGLSAYILLAAGITDDLRYFWWSLGLFALLIGGGWLYRRYTHKQKPCQ